MKKLLFVLAYASLLSACHKNTGNSSNGCHGSFVGVQYCGLPRSYPAWGIIYSNDTGEIISLFQIGLKSSNLGNMVYNPTTNRYYMYARNSDSLVFLFECDFSGSGAQKFIPKTVAKSTLGDTIGISYLLCNSRTNKLYMVRKGAGDRQYIYAINIEGQFSENLIYSLDSPGTITSPVIDEKTASIYFFSSPNLIKVDITSGASAIVASYSDVTAGGLSYCRKDGMFYGVNYYSRPYSFIRVNPLNGVVTELTHFIDLVDYIGHSFDYCTNQYIVSLPATVGEYWLDPLNGKIVKQKTTNTSGSIYVNDIP